MAQLAGFCMIKFPEKLMIWIICTVYILFIRKEKKVYEMSMLFCVCVCVCVLVGGPVFVTQP